MCTRKFLLDKSTYAQKRIKWLWSKSSERSKAVDWWLFLWSMMKTLLSATTNLWTCTLSNLFWKSMEFSANYTLFKMLLETWKFLISMLRKKLISSWPRADYWTKDSMISATSKTVEEFSQPENTWPEFNTPKTID